MEIDPKKIIDISMDLNEKTVVWVQDPQPQLKPICRQPKDQCNFTWLDFGTHAGTHVDAPFYLYSKQWTVDQIPLSRLMGRCQVLDLTFVEDMITREDLQRCTITEKKLLIKTKNSYDKMKKYNPKHVAMTADAAAYLVELGIETIGYDYQSFERNGENVLHDIFLSRNITCIDNLRLKETEAKKYSLICLPVKVTGIDGAPARAILIDEK